MPVSKATILLAVPREEPAVALRVDQSRVIVGFQRLGSRPSHMIVGSGSRDWSREAAVCTRTQSRSLGSSARLPGSLCNHRDHYPPGHFELQICRRHGYANSDKTFFDYQFIGLALGRERGDIVSRTSGAVDQTKDRIGAAAGLEPGANAGRADGPPLLRLMTAETGASIGP